MAQPLAFILDVPETPGDQGSSRSRASARPRRGWSCSRESGR
uniref:Transmembrane channel like 6 n=1 Tax=Homo sapiens TaxID=9606 RepID=K7ELP1_HUMAN